MTCANCKSEVGRKEGDMHYPDHNDYSNHYFLCYNCCDEYCHNEP